MQRATICFGGACVALLLSTNALAQSTPVKKALRISVRRGLAMGNRSEPELNADALRI